MEKINITEFKAKALALIQQVHDTGQPLIVTKHGAPVARIIPESIAAAKRGFPLGCMAESAQFSPLYQADEPALSDDETLGILDEWDADAAASLASSHRRVSRAQRNTARLPAAPPVVSETPTAYRRRKKS